MENFFYEQKKNFQFSLIPFSVEKSHTKNEVD